MLSKPICGFFTNKFKNAMNKVGIESLYLKPHNTQFYSIVPFKRNATQDDNKHLTRRSAISSTSLERITRQEPGVVRLGFIPDEWFTFFFPKTGISGLGTFAFTFSTFLISKEFYVMEHEYYGGLSMLLLCVLSMKYIAPHLAEYVDKEVDAYATSWTDIKNHNQKAWQGAIKHEEKMQESKEGELMLIEAQRENVALQLEEAYRKRLKYAYVETVKRLDFLIEIQQVQQSVINRHMAEWVVGEVSKAMLTEQLQKEALDKAMRDLKELGKTFKKLTEDYSPVTYNEPVEPPPPPKKSKKK